MILSFFILILGSITLPVTEKLLFWHRKPPSLHVDLNDSKGWTHLQYMRTSQIHRPSGKEHYRNITQNFVMHVLSLERKVPLDSLMVVLTVVEAIQFPLEIPNPNASLFFGQFFSKMQNFTYLYLPCYKGTISITFTLGSVPILCSY